MKQETEGLVPIVYELTPKIKEVKKIEKRVYSIDETTPVDTQVADLKIYLEGAEAESDPKPELFENLKLVSADFYFSYDPVDFSLKLIRPLDYDLVQNLTVSLVGDNDFKLQLEFQVKDSNNKVPELVLNKEEIEKYGSNLILVVADDLSNLLNSTVKAISSTPLPPRQNLPAIPELDIPMRPTPPFPYRTPELDEKRELLASFNQEKVIRSYEIKDTDLGNNFTVRIVHDNQTTTTPIQARIEGNMVIIEKVSVQF